MEESLPGLFLASRSSVVLPEVGMPVLSSAPWKLSYPTKPVQKEKASRLQHCRAALAACPHLLSPVPGWESGSGHPVGVWHSCCALSPSQSPTCMPGGWDTAWSSSHPMGWGCPCRTCSAGAAAPPDMCGVGPSPVLVLQSRSCCAGDPAGMGARGGPGTPRKCSDIKQPDFPVYSGSVTAGRT